ncbi:MAG: host-nuclease inhibitor Gam family protein [Desulfovibrio sp.]|jgi:phage host-nuclease inhibitor protein Gam
MAPRTKPQPLIINDLNQADEALRQLAEVTREQARIEQGLNEQVDTLKAAAKLHLEPLTASRKRLEDALAVFGIQQKGELFTERKRSQELAFGIIGFRKATSLRLLAKHTWAMVLKRLQDLNLTEGLRTKLEVDKDALRDWPDTRLETVGVKRETTDEFYIELKQEELASKAA